MQQLLILRTNMIHIRYKQSVGTNTYTVINTDEWHDLLENHPSIVEHPDLYEIVDCEIPEQHQILNYQSN